MKRIALVVAIVGGSGLALPLAGCANQPPYIHDMVYAPNAALTGMMATITGTVQYSDQDNDISQYSTQLIDPTGATTDSAKIPIEGAGTGVVGSASFNIQFTPMVKGAWRFSVRVYDLVDHVSNSLEGIVKIDAP